LLTTTTVGKLINKLAVLAVLISAPKCQILLFELPPDWQQPLADFEKRSGDRIVDLEKNLYIAKISQKGQLRFLVKYVSARKNLQISQRDLAEKTAKSQSLDSRH